MRADCDMMRRNPGSLVSMNTHPLTIVLGIVALVAALGIVISLIRASALMRGYEDLRNEVGALSKKLKADVFRDGDDLVVSGYHGKLPAVVRFSYADNTPGLNIRMKAPSTFALSIVPKTAQVSEGGRVAVRTADEMFDARFVTRTDQPTQAKMFLSGKQTLAQLQKLCCSSKTFLTMSNGNMELSELVIPSPYTDRHISDHLDSLLRVAAALGQMPGADAVKITAYQREKNYVLRTSIAVLIITGILVVVSAIRDRQQESAASTAGAEVFNSGIAPKDEPRIAGAEGWRAAQASDFDTAAVAWLSGQHRGEISGRFEGMFAGLDQPPTSAYVLVLRNSQAPRKRVVILGPQTPVFDGAFNSIAIAAVVPRDSLAGVAWQQPDKVPPPDGDGLLVVRNASDLKSGLILYSSGGKVKSGLPVNYQAVTVQ